MSQIFKSSNAPDYNGLNEEEGLVTLDSSAYRSYLAGGEHLSPVGVTLQV